MTKNPIAACFMGSDGIEDSYKNMEGTHCFYRRISLECLKNQDEFGDMILSVSSVSYLFLDPNGISTIASITYLLSI